MRRARSRARPPVDGLGRGVGRAGRFGGDDGGGRVVGRQRAWHCPPRDEHRAAQEGPVGVPLVRRGGGRRSPEEEGSGLRLAQGGAVDLHGVALVA